MDQKKIIELVKKIRIETGYGIMQIKKAVLEAEGDETKAKQILKAKGLEKAKEKAARETKQGRVFSYTHMTGKIGVLVELLCETDFVAKGDDFLALGKDLCLQVTAMGVEDFSNQEYVKDSGMKVDDRIKEVIAKLGENIQVGRVERFEI